MSSNLTSSKKDQYLRLFFEQTTDGFIFVDESGTILDWNPAAEKLTGIKAKDALDHSIVDLHIQTQSQQTPHDAGHQILVDRLFKLFKEGPAPEDFEPHECKFIHPDGSNIVIEQSNLPIKTGHGWMFGVLLRDVSDRQRRELEAGEQRTLAEALRDTAMGLNSTLDMDELLDRILENVIRVVPHDAANIMLIEGEEVRMVGCRGYAARGLDEEVILNARYRLAKMPDFRLMVESHAPIVVPDTWNSPQWVIHDINLWIRSYAGAPIQVRGQVVGFINLDSGVPNFFNENLVIRLQAFTDQAAVAVQNARLYRSLRQYAEETAALYRALTPLLNPGSDLPTLARQIVDVVLREFSSTHASLLFLDEENAQLVIAAQAGYTNLVSLDLPLDGPGITVKAALTGETIYVPDVRVYPDYVAATSDTCSELAIPLVVNDEVLGVLNLESVELDAFGPRAQRILVNYANRAALALENTLLFKEVKQHDRQLALLNEITHLSLSQDGISTFLTSLADRIGKGFSADASVIFFIDEQRSRLVARAASGKKAAQFLSYEFERPEFDLVCSTLKNEHALALEDDTGNPFISPEAARLFPFHSLLFLPLISDRQKNGAILLAYEDIHRFKSSEINFGEQASAQVALAVARAQALEIAHRRAQEAENLRQATAALSSTLDLEQILNSILNYLEKVIYYDSACVFILEGDYLVARAAHNIPGDIIGQRMLANDSLLMEADRLGSPLIIEDVQKDGRFHYWGNTNYVHGWMGVPLRGRGYTIGWLTIDHRQPGAFNEEAAALAMSFANQAAVAIENARLYDSAQRRAHELEALHTATSTLVSTLDLQVLMERILSAAVSAVPAASKGALMIYDPDIQRLHVRAAYGYTDPRVHDVSFPVENGFSGLTVRERRPLLIRDVNNDESLKPLVDVSEVLDVRSAVTAPLILEDQILGVISLDSSIPNAFNEADLHLLTSFASTVTAAIHNAQLHGEVQELAITDPLTGLYNRRGFFEIGQRETSRSLRAFLPLSAVMVDIDLLKKANDLYGHAVGDLLLKTAAVICQNGLRKVDVVCRYGGDEFAILLPGTDLQAAGEIAERLRRQISETELQIESGVISMSSTFGCAELDGSSTNLEALLKRADQALYMAKSLGRNCVALWKPEAEETPSES